MSYKKSYCEMYVQCYEKIMKIVKMIKDFIYPDKYDLITIDENLSIERKIKIIKKNLESLKFAEEIPNDFFALLEALYPTKEVLNNISYETKCDSYNKMLDNLHKKLKNKTLPFLKRVTIDRYQNNINNNINKEDAWSVILYDENIVMDLKQKIEDIIWAFIDDSNMDLINRFLKEEYNMSDLEFNRYIKGDKNGFSTIIRKVNNKKINANFSNFEKCFADIYGQNQAIQTIKKVLLRNISFYNAEDINEKSSESNKNPLATFMFYGPTGTGKTEVAKLIANFVYGDPKKLLIMDMTTYKDPHIASNALKGLPEGYKDSDKGTDFTRFLKANSKGVVVLDEFEKAHPDARELFMTMLDEGIFKDALGNVYDLSAYIFIATTNASDELKEKHRSIGFGEIGKEQVIKEEEHRIRVGLRNIFTSPILNRFNNLVCFNPISYENATEICKNLISKLCDKIHRKRINGITPKISINEIEEIIKILLKKCDFEQDGVRSLKNIINDSIGSAILEEILNGNTNLEVSAKNGKITISNAKKIMR